MKSRFLFLALCLALLGTLLLGAMSFEGESEPPPTESHGHGRGVPALARLLLGNAT